MLFLEQLTHSKAILTSISSKGLSHRQPTSIVCTFDEKTSTTFHFNYVDFQASPTTTINFFSLFKVKNKVYTEAEIDEIRLNNLVYNIGNGAWSIALESIKRMPPITVEMNAALQNSLLFIFSPPPDLFKNAIRDAINDDTLIRMTEDSHGYFYEIKSSGSVNKSQILAIVVPLHLYFLAASFFPGITLIPVGDHVQHLSCLPAMMGRERNDSLNVSLQNAFRQATAIGPDYLAGLKQFRKTNPKHTCFGTHLVRLANPFHFSTQQQVLRTLVYPPHLILGVNLRGKKENYYEIVVTEEELQTKNKEGKSLKNLSQLSKFRLRPLTLPQLQFLNSHPALSLLKDYEHPDSYFITCDKSYKNLIHKIFTDFPALSAAARRLQQQLRYHHRLKKLGLFKETRTKLQALKKTMHQNIDEGAFKDLEIKAQQAAQLQKKDKQLSTEINAYYKGLKM